ncbi:agglutinin [Artemisia annua]|nr:agglutinin [Artemisia annua]PWA68980.1 agglutinin [Artemisia annua]
MAYLTQSHNSSCIHTKGSHDIKVGGWGGTGGLEPWTFTIPNDCKLSKIRISYNECVYSIQFTYLNPQGRQVNSPVYGTDWEDAKIEILPLGIGNTLTGVSGTYGQYEDLTVITSLSFRVGGKVYGPYGRNCGSTAFSLPVVKGKITGFFGNSGDYLDNLGVILAPAY